MKVKDVVTTVSDYKKTGLLVAFPNCNFKCCTENDLPIETCQNSPLAECETKDLTFGKILLQYNKNIHSALILGGLEPFDNFVDMMHLIVRFRNLYLKDDIVIYTGYYPEEIKSEIEQISKYENIIIKFGRYIPNQKPHFDEVLGVKLASDNQYALKIN